MTRAASPLSRLAAGLATVAAVTLIFARWLPAANAVTVSTVYLLVPTSGHYAAYNGTAPIEFSSSGRTVHRLSRRGNRTLNHALHMIAVTQIRHLDSEGRTYFDRKVAEGRTKREAMRALKRQISDRVYKHLVTDTRNK